MTALCHLTVHSYQQHSHLFLINHLKPSLVCTVYCDMFSLLWQRFILKPLTYQWRREVIGPWEGLQRSHSRHGKRWAWRSRRDSSPLSGIHPWLSCSFSDEPLCFPSAAVQVFWTCSWRAVSCNPLLLSQVGSGKIVAAFVVWDSWKVRWFRIIMGWPLFAYMKGKGERQSVPCHVLDCFPPSFHLSISSGGDISLFFKRSDMHALKKLCLVP